MHAFFTQKLCSSIILTFSKSVFHHQKMHVEANLKIQIRFFKMLCDLHQYPISPFHVVQGLHVYVLENIIALISTIEENVY